jgi:hypothetical protein
MGNAFYYKFLTQHLEPRRRKGDGVRAQRPPAGASSSGGGLGIKRCGSASHSIHRRRLSLRAGAIEGRG